MKQSGNRAEAAAPRTAGHRTDRASASFPIVGVGASAGGLEAFSHLLSALPEDLGMAFVLVPHLDPNHASAMAELLGRRTMLPVSTVEHRTPVRPGHVYVIPPNKEMTIANSVLRLSSRKRGARSMPVDIFFRSLAEDQRSNGVGVILSGTATDGSAGIAAIKHEGGITFAQDSGSAKYDGMPTSAIATGCVDFVLPPAEIARELTRIHGRAYVANGEAEKADLATNQDAELALIFRIVRNVTKADFSDYNPGILKRRVLRRMALNKIANLAEYVDYLRGHWVETEALYEDLLVNVTHFFRNPEIFEVLKKTLLPVLFQDRASHDTIRVWVPGCSTGEEAYSHAICLVEYMTQAGSDVPLQVFGTDVSEAAIEQARTGTFKENVIADLSPARLRRFFRKVDAGYQVDKSIREICVFARQDVFNDPPFSRMDIVSCRNLVMNLGPALQGRIIPVFHHALKPKGFLIVGRPFVAANDQFDVADKKNQIYVKKPRALPVPHSSAAGGPGASIGHRPPREPGRPEDLEKEVERLLLESYAPPAVVVDEHFEILQARGPTGRYVELPQGKASLNLLQLARPELLAEMQRALKQARKTGAPVTTESIRVGDHHEAYLVRLEVIHFKIKPDAPSTYLITFDETPFPTALVKSEGSKARPGGAGEKDRQLQRLERELAGTKQYLQAVTEERQGANEELQSTNEEIQSVNEELQSANEALRSSKEGLETANEELNTINQEMLQRNLRLSQLTDDLTNLLNSVAMAIVMFDQDLRVRWFTLKAEKTLGLSDMDIGKSIGSLKLKIKVRDLEEKAIEVIRDAVPQQLTLPNGAESVELVRIIPYRTAENQIEGVVLTMQRGGEGRID